MARARSIKIIVELGEGPFGDSIRAYGLRGNVILTVPTGQTSGWDAWQIAHVVEAMRKEIDSWLL